VRVLHAINDLAAGGAEKLLLDLLPEMNRRGVRADLVVLDDTPHPFLRELRRRAACAIHSTGSGRPRDPRNALRLRHLVAGYDLVHAHLFPTTYWVALARTLASARTPLVLTEHNVTNRRRGRRITAAIDRIVYRRYEKVVCVSEPAREALAVHAGLPADRLVVVPNGVDLSRLDAAQPADRARLFGDLDGTARVVLQVSSFREQKDQETLVRALPLLPPAARLALVGDGPKRPACTRLAERLGVRHRVDFLGVREDVPSLLKAADLVALSSRHEGLSLASVEGLASGRPFVASDVPGLREVVGGAGLLFPPGDAEAFAEVAGRLLEEPGLAREVAERGRARAREYDLGTMVDRLLDVYESLPSLRGGVSARDPGTRPSSSGR